MNHCIGIYWHAASLWPDSIIAPVWPDYVSWFLLLYNFLMEFLIIQLGYKVMTNSTGISGSEVSEPENLHNYDFMKTYYLVPRHAAEKFAVLPVSFWTWLANPS